MPGVLAHRKHVFGVPVLQIVEHGVGISDGAVSVFVVDDATGVPLSKRCSVYVSAGAQKL